MSPCELQMHLHDTLESLYKVIPMELWPIEYLPDDYTGPSAGTTQEIVGRLFGECNI